MTHVLHVICHVSCVMCHVSQVTCQMYHLVLLSFSKNRPLADSFIESRFCVSVCCPFSCDFFLGLSFALRSHDHIPASHWRSKVDPKSGGQKWTPKVAVNKGLQKWQSKVDSKSGGQKWTPKVAAKSGPQKWRSKKDPKSGCQDYASVERFDVSRMQDFYIQQRRLKKQGLQT